MHGGKSRRWPPLLLLLLVLLAPVASGCGPGRGAGGRRAARRKLTPLVFKQHVPNVSENTLGASGLPEGRVHGPADSRFRDLQPNHNPDIVFKDEEGNGADRLMTKRCNEKLNTLAISVMNQWPGVKLRVIEAWDEEGVHASDSLHYEGRAVDITTSDRDRSKYGLLARLAVQAGFDWVYYESRSHIHCSVKSESSQAAKSGGCFSPRSRVTTPTGAKRLESVRPGDRVLATDEDNRLVYSDVLLLLDNEPSSPRTYTVIETTGGARLSLTPTHLLAVADLKSSSSQTFAKSSHTVFASRVRPWRHGVYVRRGKGVRLERVRRVTVRVRTGAVAPLTAHGTIVVDDVVASCYALFEWPRLMHWVFWPVRLLFSTPPPTTINLPTGIHWYGQALYDAVELLLPEHWLSA